MKIYNVHVVKH